MATTMEIDSIYIPAVNSSMVWHVIHSTWLSIASLPRNSLWFLWNGIKVPTRVTRCTFSFPISSLGWGQNLVSWLFSCFWCSWSCCSFHPIHVWSPFVLPLLVAWDYPHLQFLPWVSSMYWRMEWVHQLHPCLPFLMYHHSLVVLAGTTKCLSINCPITYISRLT